MSGEGRLSWIPLKMLLYDDMVGVVTSGHVTKMAVTPFNPPLSNRLLYANFTALSSIEPEFTADFYTCEFRISRIFAKSSGKY